jgi:hypothetical protein
VTGSSGKPAKGLQWFPIQTLTAIRCVAASLTISSQQPAKLKLPQVVRLSLQQSAAGAYPGCLLPTSGDGLLRTALRTLRFEQASFRKRSSISGHATLNAQASRLSLVAKP